MEISKDVVGLHSYECVLIWPVGFGPIRPGRESRDAWSVLCPGDGMLRATRRLAIVLVVLLAALTVAVPAAGQA